MFIQLVLSPNSSLPCKRTEHAAGHDIAACENAIIAPGERKLINTGVTLKMSPGFYGKIEELSGIAIKYGVITVGGVIDSDYCGEIKVVLINNGNEQFYVKKGDCIAQLIIHAHWTGSFETVTFL